MCEMLLILYSKMSALRKRAMYAHSKRSQLKAESEVDGTCLSQNLD